METKQEYIDALWDWFLQNESSVISSIERESASDQSFIKDEIDNLVLSMGMFSWEISEGTEKDWSFAISPNGSKELMKVSRQIMNDAPELDNWEFHCSKPAKKWDRRFTIYDSFMNVQSIDASQWKFNTKKIEGLIDIILQAENMDHLDDETAKSAADYFILCEIGEENKIWKVGSIDIEGRFEKSTGKNLKEIDELRGQFC